MTEASIKLVQFPRHLGIANASPFCVKLELWLKLAGIPYEIEEQVMPQSAPKKKIPYVMIDGRKVGDSTLVIEYLTESHGVDLDAGLSPEERARDTALAGMLDERLYFYIVYDRWMGDGWPTIEGAFFNSIPSLLRPLMTKFARGAVKKQLWQQGTGRHTKTEVEAMAARDIAALAAIIGDGPYVHGETIRGVDAVAYATAVNLTSIQLDTPMTRGARQHAKLVAYAERITREYFPDLA